MTFAQETLERVNAEHTHQITQLTGSFERALKENTGRYLDQIENQHVEQKKHHEEHRNALENVTKKIESCETFLKKPRNGRV